MEGSATKKGITDRWLKVLMTKSPEYFSKTGTTLVGSYEEMPSHVAVNGKLKNDGLKAQSEALKAFFDAYTAARNNGLQMNAQEFLMQNGFEGLTIEMIENERYVEGTRLLETQAFKKLLDAFTNARKRGLADCSIIKINPGTKDVKEASIDLQKNFRNSDYLGSLDDGYLYVLLANTNNADAGFVTGRIKDAGYSYEMIDGDVDGGAYGD